VSKIESILAAALAPVLAQMQAQQAELLALRQAGRSDSSRQGTGRPRGAVFGEGLVFEGERLPRMVYQDRLFQENGRGWVSVGPDGERKTVRLTDQQILVLNRVEHPTCKPLDLFIVHHMRRVFNAGTHSPAQTTPPDVPSVEYAADGTPVGEFASLYTRTLALREAERALAAKVA
jgi:hypothetical protein